jgi:hypothetical protein
MGRKAALTSWVRAQTRERDSRYHVGQDACAANHVPSEDSTCRLVVSPSVRAGTPGAGHPRCTTSLHAFPLDFLSCN